MIILLFVVLCSVMLWSCTTCVLTPVMRAEQTTLIQQKQLTYLAYAIVCCSIGIYGLLGSWQQLLPLQAASQERHILSESIRNLEVRMANAPKDVTTRLELAKSLGRAGQHAAAAEHFKQAVLLSGGRPDIILDYATAQILAENGTVGDDALKSIRMVLLISPEQPKALFFEAVYLQQQGRVTEALQAFTSLLANMPADHPLVDAVHERINQLEKQPASSADQIRMP